jgi:hypothetical protein
VTDLRKRMLEELLRRNYSPTTTCAYLRAVDEFVRYFNRPRDQLGPDHIRQHQAYLFRERKLQPNTVIQHLCGIRFFYIKTLHQSWSADLTPYPKKRLMILPVDEFLRRFLLQCLTGGIRPHSPPGRPIQLLFPTSLLP